MPAALPATVDDALRRALFGAIVPTLGYAVVTVTGGFLCHGRDGRAHFYTTQAIAREAYRRMGSPPVFQVVKVILVDPEKAAEVAL